MVLVFGIVLLLSSLVFQNNATVERCYADTKHSNETYSWFTSYPNGRLSNSRSPEDCELIYIWGLVRHGTRYPSTEDSKRFLLGHKIRDEILKNHKKGRGTLCDKDLENLKKWNADVNEKLQMQLTIQGQKDITFLAQNIKKKFPASSKNNFFEFESSGADRTILTAMIFRNEYLEKNDSLLRYENFINIRDEFLNLERNCVGYRKEITKNLALQKQHHLFKKYIYWRKMVADISFRLGYLKLLQNEHIYLMYMICCFENAWFPNSRPPFCAAFSLEDLKVIEYDYDINLYYKRGYGNKLARRVGCPIVQDMMISLSEAAENKTRSKGRFLFSHSETILPTTVKLGLSKDDEPLRADNYSKLVERRKWKTAYFNGFTGNIMVALYKCLSEKNNPQYIVRFYQNEHQTKIPQCKSNPCTLKELKEIFKNVFDINKCSTDFC